MIPMASAQTKEYATASSFCRIMHMDSGLFLGAMNQKGNLNMENLTKHSLIKAHFKAGNQKSLFDNELEEEGIENVSDEDGSEHGGSTGGGTDNQSIAGKTSKSEGGGKDQDNN